MFDEEYSCCQGCGKKTPSQDLELNEVWRLGITFKWLCKKCRTKKEKQKAYEKWRKEAQVQGWSIKNKKEKDSDVEKHRQAVVDTLNEVWGKGAFE